MTQEIIAKKAAQVANFDPNGVGQLNGKLFGLPFDYETSEVVILPVPWDVTTSYQAGTSRAPKAILEASPQLDLYDPELVDAWQIGVFLLENDAFWSEKNATLRVKAKSYIDFLEKGGQVTADPTMQNILKEVNQACFDLKEWIKKETHKALADNKLVGILGGEHSVPLGFLEALAERHEEFGILQIDAHADLRVAYEGFSYSHASIFYNALQLPQISQLVAVGIRDICEAEVKVAAESGGRIQLFYDWDIKREVEMERRLSWATFCKQAIEKLPKKVYISFDIDGLDPKLCPHTGTPVAGGLELHEAIYLVQEVLRSGRTIIGFDLCEVAPNPHEATDEWDANVGARILYKLSILMRQSQTLVKLQK